MAQGKQAAPPPPQGKPSAGTHPHACPHWATSQRAQPPAISPPDSAPLLDLVPPPTQTCCLRSGPYTRVPSHAALPHAHGKCSRGGPRSQGPQTRACSVLSFSATLSLRAPRALLPVLPLLSGATAAQALLALHVCAPGSPVLTPRIHCPLDTLLGCLRGACD